MADAVGGFLDVHDVLVQRAGDLGEAATAQRLHVAGDDLVFERLLASGALQLQFQALAQIARGDAGWLETLHDFEGGHEFLQGYPRGGRKLFDARREIAALVDVPDNHLSQRQLLWRQLRVTHLLEQHLLQ